MGSATVFDTNPPVSQRNSVSRQASCPVPVQPKLRINAVNDPAEREADTIAERIMRMPAPIDHARRAPIHSILHGGTDINTQAANTSNAVALKGAGSSVQRKCAACQTEEDALLRSVNPVKRASGDVNAGVAIEQAIGSLGGGAPLPAAERAFFEPRFGRDLSRVRVHHDTLADRASRSIDARAFALGNNIAFAGGEYRPGTNAGRSLLAHELTHVLQQGGTSTTVSRANAGNCARPTENVDEARDEMFRAGRYAHMQIQGHFSHSLAPEVPIPRGTKDIRTDCPADTTNAGRADLWYFDNPFSGTQVGEIKSIAGEQYAVRDVNHYLKRLRELSGRFTDGVPCPGAADEADRNFDDLWMMGTLGRGRIPPFEPLDQIVPTTPTLLGPFWGDPLRKNLKCERRANGAVLYWCTNRRLRDEEEQAERVRLRVPVGQEERESVRAPGDATPVLVDVHWGFRDIQPHLPQRLPATGLYAITVSDRLFTAVNNALEVERQTRHIRIDMRAHPIHQYRIVVWSTLAASLAVGTMAAIATAVAAAALIPAGAAVGTAGAVGAGTAGTGVATAEMGVVVGTISPAVADGVAKAAAAVIVVSTLAAGSSEAQAAEAVEWGMEDPEIFGIVDVTDSPFFLSGGMSTGSRVTIGGKPCRVVGFMRTP